MAGPDRSHLRNGGIFIGICALIGVGLFLFDQVRSATSESTTPVVAPSPLATLPTITPATQGDIAPTPDATPATEAGPVAQTDSEAAGQPGATHESEVLNDRARTFIDDYYRTASADADTAIGWMNAHYANQVDFFGTPTARASIISQKQAYLQRWPVRDYRLDPATAVNSCDAATSLCRMSGVVSFDASSPARGATSRGTAAFEMTVDFAGGTPTILRETSRVTSRG